MIYIRSLQMMRLFLTFLCGYFLLGCSTSQNPHGEFSNSTNSGLLLSDIAVPPGTRVKMNDSIIMGVDGRWTGLILAKSESSPTESSKYISRQMIAKGWSLVSSIYTENTSLVFTRSDKSVQIDIKDAGIMQNGSIIKYIATNKWWLLLCCENDWIAVASRMIVGALDIQSGR